MAATAEFEAERERSIGTLEGFDDEFGPWWWGITPSGLAAMLEATGFEVVERWGNDFSTT